MSIEEYKSLNTRKASVLTVGGFRPTGNPLTTHFGLKPVCLPSEDWPKHNNEPLFFVCQLNLTECPYVPELLVDVKLITFFVAIEEGLLREEGGYNWVLRTYSSFDHLTPTAIPPGCSFQRGFECKWDIVDDQPVYDEPDIKVPDGFKRSGVHLNNVRKTKVGGYASNIQSEQWWGYRKHSDSPKYCLQIDSEEKVGLAWGDSGTVYIARGTTPDSLNSWFLDWQCY